MEEGIRNETMKDEIPITQWQREEASERRTLNTKVFKEGR